ncbi:MAG: hypothetical protein IJN50_02575 [Clostridia bacterium]|nr:hypothetical protein [Clostridia bacterium]
MLLEEINEANENWLDIERIMYSPECWALVKRYDIDLCHLIRKNTGEVVYEGSTDSILKILEDTCDVEMSFERRIRKIKRTIRELDREVKKIYE